MSGEGDLSARLTRLLMQYRRIPHFETGQSPAELLFKNHYRTRLDLVRNDLPAEKNDRIPDGTSRDFQVGDYVQSRFYTNKDEKWKFGEVSQKHGKLHYEVNIEGQSHRRHQDQLTSCGKTNEETELTIEETPKPENTEKSDSDRIPEVIQSRNKEII
ncbi:uncharacterized protein [Onthophagus taurus]|uniref:uncharacterized protein n=1 Tax=Onthophagus taurus TaxID=166361 RepID=UPI0039BDA7E7